MTEQQAAWLHRSGLKCTLALVKMLADTQIALGPSLAGGYVKAKPPSFSGMKKGWPLFKMQLQACLFSLRVNGVLEDTFDQELPPQQDTVLDETDSTHASQGDTRKANTKVM